MSVFVSYIAPEYIYFKNLFRMVMEYARGLKELSSRSRSCLCENPYSMKRGVWEIGLINAPDFSLLVSMLSRLLLCIFYIHLMLHIDNAHRCVIAISRV